MSSLDQAFIRAYAKDRAAQPSAPTSEDRPAVCGEPSPLLEPHTIVAAAETVSSPDNSQAIVAPPGNPPLLAMPSLGADAEPSLVDNGLEGVAIRVALPSSMLPTTDSTSTSGPHNVAQASERSRAGVRFDASDESESLARSIPPGSDHPLPSSSPSSAEAVASSNIPVDSQVPPVVASPNGTPQPRTGFGAVDHATGANSTGPTDHTTTATGESSPIDAASETLPEPTASQPASAGTAHPTDGPTAPSTTASRAAEHRADPPQTADPVLLIDGPAARRVPRPHRRGFGSAPPHPSRSPDQPGPPLPADQHNPSAAASTSNSTSGTIRRIDPAAPSANTATAVRHASTPALDPSAPSQQALNQTTPSAAHPSAPPLQAGEMVGYRVERLVIPKLCQRLLRAAAPMFERLASDMAAGVRQGRRVCLITSPKRGEGRTTLTLCLASLLTQRSVRVLLADADFDRPALAPSLGVEPEIGWEAAASVDVDLAEILVHSVAQPGLSMLPLGGPWPCTTDTADALHWKRDLSILRDAFDLVLVDGPPLSGRPLADCIDNELSGWVDTALLVRNVGHTTADELLLAQRRLERLGITHGGVAENFVSAN